MNSELAAASQAPPLSSGSTAQVDTHAQSYWQKYQGNGTPQQPYIVTWDPNDQGNPYNWPHSRKWVITMQLALTTFTVSFSSSSYTGGLAEIAQDLNVSLEVAVLGISLYVLGFALGPLLFAPLGETFGRRIVFLYTLSAFALLQLGGGLGHSLATLLSCRLLSGIMGSSPLTNGGGVISDIWNARERGLATGMYSMVTFLGPVVGPIAGGFVVENTHLDWHFNFWLMLMLAVITLVSGYFVSPETYAPVLLRRRANKLTAEAQNALYFVSAYDVSRPQSFKSILKIALSRPFRFLVTEPIVMLLSLYLAFVYGMMYAFFSAYPIVFQQHRHFHPGPGGLAFLGLGFGVCVGTSLTAVQNRIYWRSIDSSLTGRAPPEARLHMAMLGGTLVPIGDRPILVCVPSVHYIVPILAGIPFGIGVSAIMQGLIAYLMDSYGVFFASASAAAVLLRSLGGAVFPLIIPSIYQKLGEDWGTAVFVFISLAGMPIPILFHQYGRWIRSKSRFAYHEESGSDTQEAQASAETMVAQQNEDPPSSIEKKNEGNSKEI